ncbi:carbohydrate-binding module family 18 protein, partial [Sporormia fimetaria CBS 119925]
MKLNSLCLLLFSGTAVLGAISRDGSCGGSRGATCLNSAFGNCCSQYGYCGRTSAYCGTGCQKRFAPTTKISTNGKCGPGVTCLGSKFGYCCSEYGYCGRTKEYCNSGCQKAFGSCTQLSAGDISTNARCGGTDGYTCLGSVFGDCCSQYGYCGSSTPYCGTGCQPGFGECNGQASSSTFSILTSSTSSS